MLFVNDLGGVNSVPWWMRHFPSNVSGMTIVDMVFPAFLFVMGMSIPVAIGRRLAAGMRWFEVLPHILVRTASLLIIGVLMVNDPGDNKIGWHTGLWGLLMYSAVFLSWHTNPGGSKRAGLISTVLRWVGVLALIFLTIIFRDPEGNWLRPQWWGILGLIGWAYLIATVVYMLVRENRAVLTGAIALLICVYIASHEGMLTIRWVGTGTFNTLPAIAVAGVLLSTLALEERLTFTNRMRSALTIIGFTAAGAWLLGPLYGIGKNHATPSWCLWSIAITTAVWLGLHWFVDIKKHELPFRPFRLLGTNPLFAYLLAPLLYCGFQSAGLNYHALGDLGFPLGLVRAALFALLISGTAIWAVRRGLRLKL